MKIRLFRDPAPAEGAGLPPTLGELFGEGGEPTPSEIVPPIEGGDGTPKPADLAAIAAAEAEETAAAEAAAALEAQKLIDEAAATNETTDTTPEDFFSAVDTITGEPVAVDYGETDPLSPEGVALYTQAIRKDEVMKFEAHLKATDPRSFAYMLHRQAGGDDASFMGTGTIAIPTQEEFDVSLELQTATYRHSLVSKGVDEDVADAQVAKAIKDNTLKAKADQAYNATKTAQANQLAAIENAAAAEARAYEAECTKVVNSLNNAVDTGTMKFIIPDTKKEAFKSFVKDSLRHEDGKFFMVQEVGADTKEALEAMYFKYIKGDLTSLVEKRAGTKTVQRMKLGVQAAKSAVPTGSEPPKAKGGYVPLGDI